MKNIGKMAMVMYIYIHIHCLTKKHMETYNMYDLVMTNNFRTGSHERKNMIKIAMDVFKNMVMFQFPMLNNQKINHRDLPPR